MKRIFITSAFILFVAVVNAQNVGIGTATPVAKLNVVGVGSNPAFPGSTSTAIFRIGRSSIEGLDFGKLGIAPFSAWMQAGFGGSASDPISLQPLAGNVGIGILSPTAKLDVNGTMKIQGLNTLEFGAGVVGKELNAGKIGYQTFTADALDIVGAGTLVSNRKINIFAEGGTTFNGPINVGGSTGSVGQVLTSNGTAAPTWENAAYSNNIRFAVNFSTGIALSSNAVISATNYNLNSTDVVINSTGITINRSGLYHFDMSGDVALTFPSITTTYPSIRISLDINSESYKLIYNPVLQPTTSTNLLWRGQGKESLEVYITAPTTITIYHSISFIGPIPTFGVFGYLTGHLISE